MSIKTKHLRSLKMYYWMKWIRIQGNHKCRCIEEFEFQVKSLRDHRNFGCDVGSQHVVQKWCLKFHYAKVAEVHWWQWQCNSTEFKFLPHRSRELLCNNHKAECLQSTQPFSSCSHRLESSSQSLDTDSLHILQFGVSSFDWSYGRHWNRFLRRFVSFGFGL